MERVSEVERASKVEKVSEMALIMLFLYESVSYNEALYVLSRVFKKVGIKKRVRSLIQWLILD